jgi:hypothetical protein
MKGIPIKFRAKSYKTGEYLYSTQVRQHKKDLSQGYMLDEKVYNICQLVGYDADKNEVYEGDKVNVYHGFCIPAKDLKTKTPRMTAKVKLMAEVQKVYENFNSPFDYQFLKV